MMEPGSYLYPRPSALAHGYSTVLKDGAFCVGKSLTGWSCVLFYSFHMDTA